MIYKKVQFYLTVHGGDTYQDDFSLYNKIGWKLLHEEFKERRPGWWTGPNLSEDKLIVLIQRIERVHGLHTGNSKASMEMIYTDGDRVVTRIILA